jgi:hypothetical protein
MTIRIAYPSAESRAIFVNDKYIEYNQWEEENNQYGPIKQRFCGENRYIGVKNILEFYIVPGCMIHIKPRNAIQSMVRMEWTMEAFFNQGGTTKFVDRLAGSLGIHASSIKIVSVYEGSLVVNYEIESDDEEELEAIKETQTAAFATGSVDLGAPILDVQSDDTAIIEDGVTVAEGFDPIVITQTVTNQQARQDFNPDIDILSDEKTAIN